MEQTDRVDLFVRVSEMVQSTKGAKHDIVERLFVGASDNKSLLRNLKKRKKDIINQLDTILLSSNLEMDLKLELTIIEDLLKGV